MRAFRLVICTCRIGIVLFLMIWASAYMIACSGGSEYTASKSDDLSDDSGEDGNGGQAITSPPAFSKAEARLLEPNAVFPGIVYDGSRIVVSYAKNNRLYVRPYDMALTPMDTEIQVTLDSDAQVGAGVTDHKHLFFNDAHYLLFSTIGDNDLYLMKLDVRFSRVGDILSVMENSTTTSTNDMILGTDGTYIITGQFRPPDKNNGSTSGHLIKRYTTDLENVGGDIIANPFGHANTAAMILAEGVVNFVAPSTPVNRIGIPTQRDLLLIRYTTSWDALDSAAIILVDSDTLAHNVPGDGIWMSTGLAYDKESQMLLVGHTFVDGNSGSDTGVLYFRVFDTLYREVFSEIMVNSQTANRAHFLLHGDTLYVLYDERTSGTYAVYGLQYTISR